KPKQKQLARQPDAQPLAVGSPLQPVPRLEDLKIEQLESIPELPSSSRTRLSARSNEASDEMKSERMEVQDKSDEVAAIPIKFSDTALPAWAKKAKSGQDASDKKQDAEGGIGGRPASNRWAERAVS